MKNQTQIKKFPRRPVILAVFAHPDDESFLVGGTLAYYARNGVQVKLLCLTHGEGGYNDRMTDQDRLNLPQMRKSELARCCEVLGVELLPMLDFPDGRLNEVSIPRLAWPIAQTISQHRPDMVITFGRDGLTSHPDHVAIYQATSYAFQYVSVTGSALFYASLPDKTVASLSTRLEGSFNNFPLQLTGIPQSEFDTVIKINRTSELKWQALNCHRTQSGNFVDLMPEDFALLSKGEYFRLARIAGEQAFTRYPASLNAPLSTDLFDTISRRSQLLRTA